MFIKLQDANGVNSLTRFEPCILYILSRFYCYPAFLVSQPSQGLQCNICVSCNDVYLISKSDINPKFTKPGFVIICDMQVRVFIKIYTKKAKLYQNI